ncbi:MAG TPA: hypothetical protein VEX66_09490 [Microlunatus sp.]|nr:hypothetical protein [Microlunatus sp.]
MREPFDEQAPRPVLHREYEIHVGCRPGPALLRSMQWAHRVQGTQSVIRVRASAEGLAEFLTCCADSGLEIDRMTRLDPPEASR